MVRPHRAGVSSFGMPQPAPELPEPIVLIPPIQLDSVQLPVVLVIDPESVDRLSETIRDAVHAAVLAGVGTAMDSLDTDDGQAGDPPGDQPESG